MQNLVLNRLIKNMKIKNIEIINSLFPLKTPFIVSFGEITDREIIILKIITEDGLVGYGESPTINLPLYKPEYTGTVIPIIKNILGPFVIRQEFSSLKEVEDSMNFVRGHYFAKAAISMAVADVFAQKENMNLHQFLGGNKKQLTVAKTISIYEDPNKTLSEAQNYYDEGIRWLKLKIKPGYDIEQTKILFKNFPDCKLMVDANAAYEYSPETVKIMQELEKFKLFCIEQPLKWNDFVFHAELQKELNTKISLDESINECSDLYQAHKIHSCEAVNIKVARVGGLYESQKMRQYCFDHKIPCWTGGMLESPIGILFNMAFAGHSQCVWPIDFLEPEFLYEDFYSYYKHLPFKVEKDKVILNFENKPIAEYLNLPFFEKNTVSIEKI